MKRRNQTKYKRNYKLRWKLRHATNCYTKWIVRQSMKNIPLKKRDISPYVYVCVCMCVCTSLVAFARIFSACQRISCINNQKLSLRAKYFVKYETLNAEWFTTPYIWYVKQFFFFLNHTFKKIRSLKNSPTNVIRSYFKMSIVQIFE